MTVAISAIMMEMNDFLSEGEMQAGAVELRRSPEAI